MPTFYETEMDRCIQVTLKQNYMEQVCLNRFFYSGTEEMSAPEPFCVAWWYMIGALLKPLQNQYLTYDNINVTLLFGARWSYDHPLVSEEGTNGGSGMPAFIGSRFKLFPTYSRVRKGRKIFAGVTETMMEGDEIASSFDADVAALELGLTYPVTADGIVYNPVLISLANTKHPELVITSVSAATFVGWSTQSSRKIGRGV